MNRKLLLLVVAIITACMATPSIPADTTASTMGTFETGATLSIEVNRTVLDFGTVPLGTNATGALQVNNTGTANCSVILLGADGPGNWTLENGTDIPTGFNEFCVVGNTTGNYTGQANQSITWNFTVMDDLSPVGELRSTQPYKVTLCVGTKTDEATETQTFYMNLTAAAVT